jgi:CHRD domain
MHQKKPLRNLVAPALACATLLAGAGSAFGHDSSARLESRLRGYDEVPLALSTTAKGHFSAHHDKASHTITYELSYHDLEGDVQQAHIHFGRRGLNGGIMVWLCQTTVRPAPGPLAATVPTCPQSGTVTGVINASSVLAPAGQGIEAGAFDEFVRAIRNNAGYVNVHSTKYPGGEIRGQLGRD